MRSRKVLLTLGASALALGILIPVIGATGYGPGAQPDVPPFEPATPQILHPQVAPVADIASPEAVELIEAVVGQAVETAMDNVRPAAAAPFINIEAAEAEAVQQHFEVASVAGVDLVLHADTVDESTNQTFARVFIDSEVAPALYGNTDFRIAPPTSAAVAELQEAAEALFENNLTVIRFGHDGTFSNGSRSDAPAVRINGVDVVFSDQQPVIVDGRTLVPVRAVFEHLGFDVDWDSEILQAALTRGADSIYISIGSDAFSANGEVRGLDVPATIIGGRTMLPIRALLESVGYDVTWDAENGVAVIESDDYAGGDVHVFVRVAVLLDLKDLDTDNLRFYVFDSARGVYAHLGTEYQIDVDGFLHFYTPIGGDIIITDSELTQKVN